MLKTFSNLQTQNTQKITGSRNQSRVINLLKNMLERKVLPYKDSILDQWGEGVFVNHQSSFEAATAHVKNCWEKLFCYQTKLKVVLIAFVMFLREANFAYIAVFDRK